MHYFNPISREQGKKLTKTTFIDHNPHGYPLNSDLDNCIQMYFWSCSCNWTPWIERVSDPFERPWVTATV